MPGPKDLDPSSSPRALLGSELRHAREKAGLSQEELGQRLFVSGSFVGQLEAGTRRMQPEYARMLDEVLETGASSCGTAGRPPSRGTSIALRRRQRQKHKPPRSGSTRRS